MDLFVGITTIFILFFLFKVVCKKQPKSLIPNSIFILIVLFSSYAYNPSDHFWFWIGFCFLFFSTLEDLHTMHVHILPPLLSFFLFYLLTFNHVSFVITLFVFFLFYILYKFQLIKTISEGDAYLFLPFLYLSSFHLEQLYLAFLLCFLLSGVILYTLASYTKKVEFPFAPFITFSLMVVYTDYYPETIIFILFMLLFPSYLFYQSKNR